MGVSNLGDKISIPNVNFSLVDDQSKKLQLDDPTLSEFGYNTIYDSYTQPIAYSKYVEPLDVDLLRQVEYDMDEQDKEWVDDLNNFRSNHNIEPISYEVFEIVIDKLEKEFLDLQKKLPVIHSKHSFSEDSNCSICNESECENSNAIVFCDGCNLAVHQDCYGIPYIPEGQWLCRKCTVSPENPVNCVLCPNEGGAFKQTNTGSWAHVLCANWIPETSLSNPVYQEPVEGVDRIPKSRWKLVCYICKQRHGACIQCDDRNCFIAMHPTCANQYGLICKTKNLPDGTDVIMRALCHRHRPKIKKSAPLFELEEQNGGNFLGPINQSKTSSKAARAHSKNFNPGPPLCPQYIVDKIKESLNKVELSFKQEVIFEITKYWALKREKRRGAGLIRRLHLEPWSSNMSSHHSEADKKQKMEFMIAIRDDLLRFKRLVEKVYEREAVKHEQTKHVCATLDHFFFPNFGQLRLVFERIVALDTNGVFSEPVSSKEVPDYYNIIKNPMDWSKINNKIEKRMYKSVESFKNDVLLIYANAMTYNKSITSIYKSAQKQQAAAMTMLESLNNLKNSNSGNENGIVGNLESSNEVIKMLKEQDGIEKLFDTTKVNDEEIKVNNKKPSTSKSKKKAKKVNKPKDKEAIKARQEMRAAEATKEYLKLIEGSATGGARATRASLTKVQKGNDNEETNNKENFSNNNVVDQSTSISPSNESLNKDQYVTNYNNVNRGSKKKRKVGDEEGENEVSKRKRKTRSSTQHDNSIDDNTFEKSNTEQFVNKRSRTTRKSEVTINQDANQPASISISKTSKPNKNATEKSKGSEKTEAQTKEDDDNNITGGTLVWAKLVKYPHFPAETYDPEDEDDAEEIPRHVLKVKPNSKFEIYLVRFFDAKRTWSWIPRHNLVLLGWDDVDQQYLDRKRFLKSKEWEETKVAYRKAMAALVEEGVEEEDEQ